VALLRAGKGLVRPRKKLPESEPARTSSFLVSKKKNRGIAE
jgi:hypothetical protein